MKKGGRANSTGAGSAGGFGVSSEASASPPPASTSRNAALRAFPKVRPRVLDAVAEQRLPAPHRALAELAFERVERLLELRVRSALRFDRSVEQRQRLR